LFLLAQTQWRESFAGISGLDYVAVFKIAEATDIQINYEVLTGIRHFETLTLNYWHNKMQKDRNRRHV
jgi:hypothetical protein